MAVDKLVDSGKLDACCEAEAAAIIAKGGGTAPLAYDFANNKGFADAINSIPSGGITPSGKKLITDTSETDVTAFAMAQVSSDTLLPENIKKNVNILGVVGSFEGGGDIPLPPGITKQDCGSFTLASDTLCSDYPVNHALGVTPKGFIIWSDDISAYEPSSNYAMKYFCVIAEAYNTGASAKSFANGALVYRVSTGKTAGLSSDATTAEAAATWANSSTIALVRVTINYKANVTYKWIAWA